MRKVAAVAVLGVAVGSAGRAGPPAPPRADQTLLSKREGTWDTILEGGGKKHKGMVTFKMELGGLWLVGSLRSDLDKMKFSGKSMDTYDARKQKYVSVWFDSMSTTPMVMEGTSS